jgi:hypothetical protein
MNDKYIIISKTDIETRIKKLLKNNYKAFSEHAELDFLRELLSQSTHLIPEISKAYDAGKLDRELSLSFDNPKSRYLNSLKIKL